MKDCLGNEFDALTTMNNLIRKLAAAGVPFEVRGFPSGMDYMCGTLQICAPSIRNCAIGIVCHGHSYGHEEGPLEALVNAPFCSDDEWDDGVRPCLDSEQAFDLIKSTLDAYKAQG